MPEVRVNIAMGIANAKSTSEIAGIPGRITKVRDTARAFMNPEFGASIHMAEVLLAVMEKASSIRAVINIKHDEYVDKVLRRLGYSFSSFELSELSKEAQESKFPTFLDIKKVVDESEKVLSINIDKGGYGIEPMAYIFGESATDVARKAIRIAGAMREIK
jgi:predicted fused transcriptional regulator/phosphomethylpyrimidine kinase